MVQKYNLGAILDENTGNFDETVQYILDNEKLILKNLKAQQKPNAAENTARFLLQEGNARLAKNKPFCRYQKRLILARRPTLRQKLAELALPIAFGDQNAFLALIIH